MGCLVSKYSKYKVISFETVPELVNIARDTIKQNRLISKNTVWHLHTTEDIDYTFMNSTFGKRARGIISELLDTTFLGEGLHEGLAHGKLNILCAENPIMIPRLGRILMQAFTGSTLNDFHCPLEENFQNLGFKWPSAIFECGGVASASTGTTS